MTDQPKTALDTFLATAKRIEGLFGEADTARNLPSRSVSAAQAVEIRPAYYSSDHSNAEAAREIQKRLVDEKRAAGEAARDARLAEIAAELQSLRAVLPQQAAAVSIELGHQARLLQHEANGGTL